MTPSPLLSIGHLIDAAWEAYRHRYAEFLSLSGWLVVSTILSVIALTFYPTASKLASAGIDFTSFEIIGVFLYFVTHLIIEPVIGLFVFVAIIRLTEQSPDRQKAVRESVEEAKKLFLPAAGIAIVFGLLITLIPLIGMGIPFSIGAIGVATENAFLLLLGNILLVLGIMISFVCVIRFFLFYAFALYARVIDGITGKNSFRASQALVKGRFWAVFGRYAVPKIVFILFGIVAIFLVGFVVQMLIGIFSGLNVDLQLRLTSIALTVIPSIVVILIYPLMILSDTVLYHELTKST